MHDVQNSPLWLALTFKQITRWKSDAEWSLLKHDAIFLAVPGVYYDSNQLALHFKHNADKLNYCEFATWRGDNLVLWIDL